MWLGAGQHHRPAVSVSDLFVIAKCWHAACAKGLVRQHQGWEYGGVGSCLPTPAPRPQYRSVMLRLSSWAEKQQILTWVASCDEASAVWDSTDGFTERMRAKCCLHATQAAWETALLGSMVKREKVFPLPEKANFFCKFLGTVQMSKFIDG